jgi:integrase
MTTHLGRRTFITLCLEKGMLPNEIMQITGHTDMEMLMRYFNKDKEEVRAKAMQLWNDAP